MQAKQAPLKVRAQNLEDIIVVSSNLQDAIAPVIDMGYEPAERRFVMVVNRFMWEAGAVARPSDGEDDGFGTDEMDELPADAPRYLRVNCGIRIHGVSQVRRRNIDLKDRGVILNLLAVRLDGDAIIVDFSGSASLALTVDDVDLLVEDLGEPWITFHRPDHDNFDAGQPEEHSNDASIEAAG